MARAAAGGARDLEPQGLRKDAGAPDRASAREQKHHMAEGRDNCRRPRLQSSPHLLCARARGPPRRPSAHPGRVSVPADRASRLSMPAAPW